MRCGRFSLRLAIIVSVCTARGGAQQPAAAPTPALRAISGTVADADGNPLDGAEVALRRGDSTTRLVRSDINGHFQIDALPAGSARLRVRRLGFQERVVGVSVSAERPTTVFVKLEQAVAALGVMSIDAASVEANGPLREFYSRARANHFGHFLDEAQLAAMHPQQTSDALRAIPGVLVRPSRRIGNEVKIRGCSPLVWVDGLRAPNGELDDLTRGPDVAAMEIYTSLAGVPAQYTDRTATCGTILVWLKTR
jgi:hypothetical protein